MVRAIKKETLPKKIRRIISSRFFIPIAFLTFVVITVPIIQYLATGTLDIRQRAAAPKPTATLNISPFSGEFSVGQTLSATVVIDGGGQAFNAAQAEISISSNLQVMSLIVIPPEQGGCNFTFSKRKVPTVSNPSFAGSIASGFSQNCSLFTMTLQVNAIGDGMINLSRAAVKAYKGNWDILYSTQNGNYTLIEFVEPTLTPTPTSIPTAVPATLPTATPRPILN
ncbi:MAG: hypothetical protein Q7T54_03290 [Candidatus Levybacteria bacterium]|nr:hypothetical protein [Candidatus Levybacteria bacterium]